MLTPDPLCKTTMCSCCGTRLGVNTLGVTYDPPGRRSFVFCSVCVQPLLRSVLLDYVRAVETPNAELWLNPLLKRKDAEVEKACLKLANTLQEWKALRAA